MLPRIRLFDPVSLSSLVEEFRDSMRALLADLCDDLAANYRPQVDALRLPLGYFRFLGDALKREAYAGWKVAGWVEELNDLLYFVDLQAQLRRERDLAGVAADLLAECEEKFYENSYLDELFPRGEPEPARLTRRVDRLCARLARQVVQESLFLVPGLPCLWLAREGRASWTVSCDLRPNFERAEREGCLYVGWEGVYLEPPSAARRALASREFQATVLIRQEGIRLRVGRATVPVMSGGQEPEFRWRVVPPGYVRPFSSRWPRALTLGDSLIYGGRDLTPHRVAPSPKDLADRVGGAVDVLEAAWPEGAQALSLLTARIVPLKARGVVSFSYRHRPRLSFLNTFDRDQFDLIDDLVHENSHHHLNLLLRKYEMRRGDRNREIFYSPWRRSLRPLHGILHATFTFTMGAILFERLSSWGARVKRQRAGGNKRRREKQEARLTEAELLRARFRCLEEVASVEYSLRDLLGPARKRGWLMQAGLRLVHTLEREIRRVRRRIAPHRAEVLRSHLGSSLRRHIERLARVRVTYGRALGRRLHAR